MWAPGLTIGLMASRRPVIGITTYVASARCAAWDMPVALLPAGYVEAASRAGGRPVLLPPSRRSNAPDSFCIGVLWHPEEGDDERLFAALVGAASGPP
jgi:gamma-glutamyl-gamma-aminobutyrate hydrolase PuuD